MTTTEDPRLVELQMQEDKLHFAVFNNDTALNLGLYLLENARKRELSVTISVRRNGHRLFHAALPGTSADNDAWIERKSRVVDRYGNSSYLVGMRFRTRGGTFEERARLDPNLYAAYGGAFPIIVKDVGTIGAVCISGLSEEDDHAFVVEQLGAFLREDRS